MFVCSKYYVYAIHNYNCHYSLPLFANYFVYNFMEFFKLSQASNDCFAKLLNISAHAYRKKILLDRKIYL